MRVFVSWSGERSRKVALLLRDWLPSVLQAVVPFVSDEDIPKGAQWLATVNQELSNSWFGIICVTPENRGAAWLNFEAGAIANAVGESRVCPLLLDVKGTDLQPPMSIFQMADATEPEIWKLVKSLNSQLPQKLADEQLRKTYERWWPDLFDGIRLAMKSAPEGPTARRDTSDLVQEILMEVREQSRVVAQIAAKVLPAATAEMPGSSPFESLAVGDKVSHPKWGLGEINSLIGAGATGLAVIDFTGVGPKMVMLKYAPLTKISSTALESGDGAGKDESPTDDG